MERLEEFTPIHPKKAAFYKSLLSFYKNIVETVPFEELTYTQQSICLPLENFNDNGTYVPTCDVNRISIIDKKIVDAMRPTMKVKVAIYNLLVKFFDETLSSAKGYEEGHDFAIDENENFISIAKKAMPEFIGISVISPRVLQEYEENKSNMPNNRKKKTYQINVHFDAVVGVEVEAYSEEEAKKIAEETADFDDYEIVGVTSCVTDVIE